MGIRNRLRLAAAMSLLLAAATAAGQGAPRMPPAVENLSSTQPDGTRTLELRVVVPARVPAVWEAVATVEGFRTWAAPVVGGEFRLGGAIEASYDFAAKIGDRENIRNQVVAIVPQRMLAIRNVQAPTKAPFDVASFQSLHTVMFLEPRGADATAVTLVTPGVGSGPANDGVYKHFEWGNAYSLEMLRRRFVDGPKDWAKAAEEARLPAEKAKAGK